MSLKNISKNKAYNPKRCMDKIIVTYLISILTIGTVLPTIVQSDPARFYSLDSQAQAPSGVNQPPVFGTPNPANGSVNNPISLTWSIPINDPESDQFSWTIQCSNGQRNNGCGQTNGTKSLSLTRLTNSTNYKIWVNATDPTGSGLCTRRWYTFTTKTNLVNNPPVFGTSSPANGSTGNPLSLSWNIPINDPEGNTFTWTIQCSNKQKNNGTAATNGTKTLSLIGLTNSTTYKIWVNATDPAGSGLYTRRWYTFTTTTNPINKPPVFGTSSPANGSTGNPLSLSWKIPINDPEGNTFTWTIQCNNGQTNTTSGANNGTKTLVLSGLTYASTYKIWVNATDPTGSGLYTRRWYTFTTRENSPPLFGTSSPTNGSTGNPLSLSWSIPINDPEGNTFSWTIQCSNGQVTSGTGASNGTKSLLLTTLTYSKTYKVWANATDPAGSVLYTRKWYTFTTKQLPPMKVIITKPLENKLYIHNLERRNLSTNTIIYGPITIKANVTSEINITKVKFYIDGRLKDTVTKPPYNYLWKPIIQFHNLSLKHTIKVIAYDSLGNNASAELIVTKWRFHPLLFVPLIAGVGIASTFFKHTTVTGFFFNIQQSTFTTSFCALHIHYWTTDPFKNFGGVINFKSCTGGAIIGPLLSLQPGSLHHILYGTFTFLGDIQYTSGGFGKKTTTQPLPPTLKDVFQNLKP